MTPGAPKADDPELGLRLWEVPDFQFFLGFNEW